MLALRTLIAVAVCNSVYGRPMSADPKAIARLVGDAFLKESSPPAAGLHDAAVRRPFLWMVAVPALVCCRARAGGVGREGGGAGCPLTCDRGFAKIGFPSWLFVPT